MVAASMEKALQEICKGSPGEIGLKFGLVAGLSYHFLFQFPRQAEVLKCLLAIAFCNLVFVFLAVAAPKHTIWTIYLGGLVFNMTLVHPFPGLC